MAIRSADEEVCRPARSGTRSEHRDQEGDQHRTRQCLNLRNLSGNSLRRQHLPRTDPEYQHGDECAEHFGSRRGEQRRVGEDEVEALAQALGEATAEDIVG